MMKLHPRHGLNPTMVMCFWCGEDRGEIALLGAACKGEAPQRMIVDYEPCDTCREQWQKGIVLVEVTREPNAEGQPPLPGAGTEILETAYGPREFEVSVYPTGNLVVVTRECIERMFEGDIVEQTISQGKALIEVEAFQMLFADAIGGVS